MRKIILAAVALALVGGAALAHFQVILPSRDIVSTDGPHSIDLSILFTHPMEQGPVMQMGAPRQFGLMAGEKKIDLQESLKPRTLEGKTAYAASYEFKQPGDHVFFIEPAPYYEAAEEKMIIHYAKVIVNAFGLEEGWDTMVGLPVEIEPLVRPYGLWTGNEFRGIVKQNGKAVPFATVEIEYLNEGSQVKPPADPFVTQAIKADANGVFGYAMPRAGWWAFAALLDGDEKMANPDGKMVDVELGGLIWVKTVDMK